MSYVFVLVAKERTFDAQQVVLTAVTEEDLTPMYSLAETYASDTVDLMCRTYQDGEIVEISLYKKDLADFEKIVDFYD